MNLIKAYKFKSNELMAEELISLPINCPFGNLDTKYSFILTRLNLLNETIQQIHKLWRSEHNNFKNYIYTPAETHLKRISLCLRFSSEIKILVDEMISLNYLLKTYSTKKEWPKKIKIDCIGAYLNEKNKAEFDTFNNNLELLKEINDIGNSVKHSFVNSDILWIRNMESSPVLFSIYNQHNSRQNPTKLIAIKLDDFITSFNTLLESYSIFIKEKYRIN